MVVELLTNTGGAVVLWSGAPWMVSDVLRSIPVLELCALEIVSVHVPADDSPQLNTDMYVQSSMFVSFTVFGVFNMLMVPAGDVRVIVSAAGSALSISVVSVMCSVLRLFAVGTVKFMVVELLLDIIRVPVVTVCDC